jgi:hypothetical protein
MGSLYSPGDVAQEPLTELSNLGRKQAEALQKAPYALMSKSEQEAYDRRRLRIAKVGKSLPKILSNR